MKAAPARTKYLLMGGIFLAAVVVLELLSLPFDLFREKSAFLNFSMLLLGFALLTFFILKRDLTNLTSWWSLMVLVQFGIAPFLCDFLGIDLIDSYSVQALVYVFLGTACFWAGAKMAERSSENPSFAREALGTSDRRTYVALAMLAVGCLSKLYMIRAGLYMYGSDVNMVEAASQYREWLTILGGATLYAQIVLSVEFFCSPKRHLTRFAFWLTTAVNISFAVVSGMKGEIIIIPFLILLVRKLAVGKFEMRLAMGLVALLLLMFPLNAAYRSEVHDEGSITSIQVGKNAIGRAVGSVSEGSKTDYVDSAIESAANRMNLLPVIVFLDQEKDMGGTSIEGDERLWMIPFYPFVPRYFWKDKPVLDKGRRLSVAMGSTESSSTAVTPFGDLLVRGGLPGMLIGMACVGALIQFITNLISKDFAPKALFIYCALFAKFYAPEMDVVMLGTSLIQSACVAFFVAYLVYGGKLFRLEPKGRKVTIPGQAFSLRGLRSVQLLQPRLRR